MGTNNDILTLDLTLDEKEKLLLLITGNTFAEYYGAIDEHSRNRKAGKAFLLLCAATFISPWRIKCDCAFFEGKYWFRYGKLADLSAQLTKTHNKIGLWIPSNRWQTPMKELMNQGLIEIKDLVEGKEFVAITKDGLETLRFIIRGVQICDEKGITIETIFPGLLLVINLERAIKSPRTKVIRNDESCISLSEARKIAFLVYCLKNSQIFNSDEHEMVKCSIDEMGSAAEYDERWTAEKIVTDHMQVLEVLRNNHNFQYRGYVQPFDHRCYPVLEANIKLIRAIISELLRLPKATLLQAVLGLNLIDFFEITCEKDDGFKHFGTYNRICFVRVLLQEWNNKVESGNVLQRMLDTTGNTVIELELRGKPGELYEWLNSLYGISLREDRYEYFLSIKVSDLYDLLTKLSSISKVDILKVWIFGMNILRGEKHVIGMIEHLADSSIRD